MRTRVDIADQLLGSGSPYNDAPQPTQRSPAPAGAASDEDLARRATDGDRIALGELYHRYAADVAAVCAGRGPAHEVDDLVHDTFMALLASDGLDEPAKVRNWLVRTARNLAIDASRAHRNSRTDALPHQAHPTWATAASDDPGTSVVDRAAFRQLLTHLDDRDATLFVRHYELGTPMTVLADTFALTPGAIRTRMHRARATLKTAARGHGLAGLIPAPLLRTFSRWQQQLPTLGEPALATLLPIMAGIGIVAVITQPIPTDAALATPRSSQHLNSVTISRLPLPLSTAADASDPDESRHVRNTRSGTTTDDGSRSAAWSSDRPPLIETDPLHTPAGRVATDQPSAPDYEYGADPGISHGDTHADVVVSIHDEPALEPAAAATCPTANQTPATYCREGEE